MLLAAAVIAIGLPAEQSAKTLALLARWEDARTVRGRCEDGCVPGANVHGGPPKHVIQAHTVSSHDLTLLLPHRRPDVQDQWHWLALLAC